MAWQPIPCDCVRGLAHELSRMGIDSCLGGSSAPRYVWRGEPEVFKEGIKPRIDRPGSPVPVEWDRASRVQQELHRYEDWWVAMQPLMLARETTLPTRKPDGLPDLAWLNVAAHYGCHTRLVDWTESPWVALFFACARYFAYDSGPRLPGRLWCFDRKALDKALQPRLDDFGVPVRDGSQERDFVRAAFRSDAKRWIVTQHNDRGPARMSAQFGLFTIAGPLNVTHDELLDELVPDGSKFRVEIPSDFKIGLLGLLNSMGIHHESVQYHMIDTVAGDIAKAYLEKLGG